MRSTFGGFELAKRAINASRLGVDVTANNIANANTRGYTRRVVQLEEAYPLKVAVAGNRQVVLGSGVQVQDVVRIRSVAIDASLRRETGTLGQAEANLGSVQRVESLLSEPGEDGINAALSKFWSLWDEVAKRPDEVGLRTAVIEQGATVAEMVRHLATEMDNVKTDEQLYLSQDVQHLNSLVSQVADLNKQISKSISDNITPVDMMDERDRLLDDISFLVDVEVTHNSDGTVSVASGGRWLVDKGWSREVQLDFGADGLPTFTLTGEGPYVPSNGVLSGRNSFLQALNGYRTNLSLFAGKLRDGVNAIHALGHTGKGQLPLTDDPISNEDFFVPGVDGEDAALSLHVQISDPWKVAADKVEGNPSVIKFGATAAAISALKDDTSISEGYFKLVDDIARDTERLDDKVSVVKLTVEQQASMRDEMSGVSEDEEMLELVKYESSYNAAAKLVTIMDEMIQSILNLIR